MSAKPLLQVLIYGSCDKPGPDKEDIALIIQVMSCGVD